MKLWIADWLRHWAHKLDGRKVLTLDKADRYRVEIGHGWVKVTSLVDGAMNVGLPADKPVSVTTVGAGGRVSGVRSTTAAGFGGYASSASTGRYSVTPPAPQDLPRKPRCIGGDLDSPRHAALCPAHTQGCECEYWPGITGSNGRITQHAVGCPQRPDTKVCAHRESRGVHDWVPDDPNDIRSYTCADCQLRRPR